MSLEPTQFTRESAERIANVVRAAELATPAARPLSFAPLQDFRGTKVVKVATFTGGWAIGETKQVTLKFNTSVTAMAANLFYPLGTSASARDCLVAKSDGTWFLASVPLATATAIFVTSTATGTYVKSITTASRSVVTGITPTTASLTFVTSVAASLNTASCSISVTSNTSTASYVSGVATSSTALNVLQSFVSDTQTMITGTATGTYLRLGP
jgi:hypothetical protein